MKYVLTLVFSLVFITSGFTQKLLSDYQYLILPIRYDFLNSPDEYRLNTQTRYLLKKKGFVVYYDNEVQFYAYPDIGGVAPALEYTPEAE